ncbi:SMP-30/gluconolactonase/LRE family protein [Pseudomonas abieticivorans]|uniref:SMP-30/gluconolactonase/LRE family protein n=1 Tax=Pseudomonas abieticivorans TaxID=2931382 RepID=UPI0020C14415|nr:SMP-30/gluconolactonase/LRE family protein [Pseudomonas sp. PIA16]
MNWQAITPHRFKLAEGPFWDPPTGALYWVDIAGFKACRLQGDTFEHWQLSEPVSAFIPAERGDALVTLASGVYRLDLQSPSDAPGLSLLCVADPHAGNRANEARCDAKGHLWLGSMQNNLDEEGADLPLTRRSGGLFHVDHQAWVTPLLAGQGIVNTLLWSPQGDALYSADTLDGVIYRYPINPGPVLGERQVHAGRHPRGAPDGSAMDAEGFIWNARWDGGCLLRFAPDGRVDRVIELPLCHPTSCVFGGPDLRTLFVTSSAQVPGPFEGAVMAAQVDVQGAPCHRYSG